MTLSGKKVSEPKNATSQIECPENALRILPLGGLGEIGLNMTLFEVNGKILIVDCGLMFPEDHMLGVDIVIPDFSYLDNRQKDIIALILTHGHEDHIGAVPYLLRRFSMPVYGTRLTLALLANKLNEHKITGVPMHYIHPDRPIRQGDFKLDFVRVSHSIMDGVAVGIDTPQGYVVHSGDFKLDFAPTGSHTTDIRALSRFGDRNVLCLLSDSTNVEQLGYTMTEQEVGKKLGEIFHDANGRIIITLFASNIARIQQVFNIAAEYGRKVCLSGKSMLSTVRIARELGYLSISDAQQVDIRNLSGMSHRRIVVLTTGSQGEPMSALTRIASRQHKHIRITEGDTVILSSKFIPGNEGIITNLINEMFRQGAQVAYETISEIHTSGHAHKEELKLMLKLIRPKFFIPIHGEMRHLVQHLRLAQDMGIKKENLILAKNGDMIEFFNGKAASSNSTVTGRVFVDGKGVGDVGNIILTDRRLLSESGVVTCTIVHDDHGVLLEPPQILSKGFVYEPDFDDLFDAIRNQAAESFEKIRQMNLLDEPEGRDQLARDIRRLINKRIQRRPVVIPVFIRV